MTVRLIQYAKPVAGIAALSLLAACSSDLTGGNRHPVQLSFTTKAAISAPTNGGATGLVVGPEGTIKLTSVELVLRKIELDRIGTADCVGDIEDENDDERNGDNGRMDKECEEFFRGPLLINLPVDGTLVPVIQGLLAAGDFTELEAKLAPARRNSTFNIDHPDLVGKSVRVKGTFTEPGSSTEVPFVFTSAVRAKLEMEFDPPLVVNADTKNTTVRIDVDSWFRTFSGVIDPRTATAGSANLARIENNIRRSFHAFEDDDERGEDRHEGHHGNDDGHD